MADELESLTTEEIEKRLLIADIDKTVMIPRKRDMSERKYSLNKDMKIDIHIQIREDKYKTVSISYKKEDLTKESVDVVNTNVKNIVIKIKELIKKTELSFSDVLNFIEYLSSNIEPIFKALKNESTKEKLQSIRDFLGLLLDNIKINLKLKGIKIPSFISKFILKIVLNSLINKVEKKYGE